MLWSTANTQQQAGTPQGRQGHQPAEEMRRIEDPGAETSNQNNSSWDPTEHHGAKIKGKEEDTVRIITVQINSFPTSTDQKDKIKTKILKDLIQNATPDFMLTQEDTKNWEQVDPTRRPKEVEKTGSDHSTFTAQEIHTTTHITDTKREESPFGPWTTLHTTQPEKELTLPCKSHGPHTTYTQQVNALNKTQDL